MENERTAKVWSERTNVYVKSYTDSPVKRLFPNKTITREQAYKCLKTRCWDSSRPDIRELLVARGIKDYDPLEIVKKTHGVSWNDYLWIKFPGENLRAEDVLVRKF